MVLRILQHTVADFEFVPLFIAGHIGNNVHVTARTFAVLSEVVVFAWWCAVGLGLSFLFRRLRVIR